jgi:hypothetical protein
MGKPVTKFPSAAVVPLWLAAFAIGGQAENRKRVMGSVYRMVNNLIEVKEEERKVAVVHLDAATSFVTSSTQAREIQRHFRGPSSCHKVVVKNGVDTASEVRSGAGQREVIANLGGRSGRLRL